jgi:Leucine-rich repeat (LRR) protein
MSMINLETLSFQFNRLEIVESDAFKGLTNLKYLSFHYNKLTSFDQVDLSTSQSEMFNLLNLSFNQIESFNKTKEKNDKVITLDLSSNKLDSFYFHGKDYFTSKNIILSGNKVTTINGSQKLKLDSLLLDKNKNIFELTWSLFQNVDVVTKLNLQNNRINKIHDYTFENLQVEEINLENNNLTEINYLAFKYFYTKKYTFSLKVTSATIFESGS